MSPANAGDTGALTEGVYADDAQLLPPNTPVASGKAAIRDSWKAFLAQGIACDLETVKVHASGYGFGKYRYTASSSQQMGEYVVVYRRPPNGAFLAVADSFNSNG